MLQVWTLRASGLETEHQSRREIACLSHFCIPIRGHWAIENSLDWVLDVGFSENQPRRRKGFGAKNMAVVRHFALNLVRSATDKNQSGCGVKSPAGHQTISNYSSTLRARELGYGALCRCPGSGSSGAFEAIVDGAPEALIGNRRDGDAGETALLPFAVELAQAFE